MDEFDLSQAVTTQARTAPSLAVRFYSEPQKDEAKSKAEGRAIFRDVTMVEIRVPGESDAIRRPVREFDKQQYPRIWAAFEASQSQEAVEGFPLAEWSGVTRAQAEELKFFGVRTVEQFAEMPDTAVQRVGPYMQLRQAARDWLKQAKGASEVNKLRSENNDLKARLTALEEIVSRQTAEIEATRNSRSVAAAMTPEVSADPRFAALEARLAELTKPKRRGRPPKNGTT